MEEIEYAKANDGTNVAYRVLEADADRHEVIVMVSGGLIPMQSFEEDPGFVRLIQGLRTIGRLVMFDRRGIGLSDPIVDWETPILDQWADDLLAVSNASGVTDSVVFAWDGYGIATRFAARHPGHLRRLVLFHPASIPDDQRDVWVRDRLEILRGNLGGEHSDLLKQIAPSRASEPGFREWYLRAGRVGASPAAAAKIWESVFSEPTTRQLLEEVVTPTLILCRSDSVYSTSEMARRAASRISGATLVELSGSDHFPFIGDIDSVIAEVASFVVGQRRLPPPQRMLVAIMFTDLVSSTERAASLGDSHWKSMLDRHDAVVRAAVGNGGGTLVKSTGDGVVAHLPSASAAVNTARRIRDHLALDGLLVRIGIHVGDIDRRGDDVSGIGVHIAARVMALAEPGEITVTSSVQAAVIGQFALFDQLGTHELRGVPGTWELFRVPNATSH